jgi:hypothetical protein
VLLVRFCHIDTDYNIAVSPCAQAAFQLATVIVRLLVIADKTRRNATILAPGPLHIWIAGEALSSSFLSRLGSLFKVLPCRYSASTRQRSRIKQLKALQIQACVGSLQLVIQLEFPVVQRSQPHIISCSCSSAPSHSCTTYAREDRDALGAVTRIRVGLGRAKSGA